MLKKFIILSSMLILTNCYPPGAALLGPSITVATTGNIYQAGLSYSSGHMLKKAKKSLEKIKETKKVVYLEVDHFYKKINKDKSNKDKLNKDVLTDQRDYFFKAVEDNFKKYN